MFAAEYLLGPTPKRLEGEPGQELLVGDAAIVVPADDVEGFAHALTMLLADDALRGQMGRRALEITIPYFTWAQRTRDLETTAEISRAISAVRDLDLLLNQVT